MFGLSFVSKTKICLVITFSWVFYKYWLVINIDYNIYLHVARVQLRCVPAVGSIILVKRVNVSELVIVPHATRLLHGGLICLLFLQFISPTLESEDIRCKNMFESHRLHLDFPPSYVPATCTFYI